MNPWGGRRRVGAANPRRRTRLMRVGQGWLTKQLRRFAADRDGAAALEFALVLPPLCLILLGMFEVSMVMFTQASMEGAMREAARYGITGINSTDPAAREGQILAIVDQYTLNLVDMSKATISYQVYGSFNSIDKPEPFGDTNGNGKYDVGEPYTDVNGVTDEMLMDGSRVVPGTTSLPNPDPLPTTSGLSPSDAAQAAEVLINLNVGADANKGEFGAGVNTNLETDTITDSIVFRFTPAPDEAGSTGPFKPCS